MRFHVLSQAELARALGAGLVVGILLSVVMVPANLTGVAPMPKPPSLAFAEALVGASLPLPVGLAFHLAYNILWTVIFIVLFKHALTFRNALLLSLVLWVIALVVIFPINGWGLLGLGVNPVLMLGALVPHLIFAVALWGVSRLVFGGR